MKVKKYITYLLKVYFLILGISLYAQRYPVQVTQTVIPPYTSKLSDYVTATNVRFRLNILLTDVLAGNRQVRLKLHIKGNGLDIQSTDFVVGAPPVFLNGGVLQQSTNLDLSAYFQPNNLIGISPQQYSRPLREGVYTICWEVYDMFTNRQINNPALGCSTVFLLLNEPPFLNLPYKGDQIVAKNPMNIIFQWTQRHTNATNVSYDFELREIWDTNIDPQAAFLGSPNYYTETVNTTTLLYNISKPTLLPKKTYGWRVKAKSLIGISENSIFKNDGYSEIFYFTYTNKCDEPNYILSKALGGNSVKITWQGNFEHKKFHVQYKRADIEDAEWFDIYTYNNQSQIGNLREGKTYLFRVGGSCNELNDSKNAYSYSNVSEFTMPNNEDVVTYNCGIIPEIDIQNFEPLKNIGVNETFTAGDFPVTVKNIRGGNGVYSGNGYIVVPYLADTKIEVFFYYIKINNDYQLTDGVIETAYDINWEGVSDANDLALGGEGNSESTIVNFPIDDVQIDANRDIIVIGTNGELVELPGGEDYVITDSNGQTWSVDEEGNITETGKIAEGGATNSENTNGVNDKGEVTAITAKGVEVTFTKGENSKYELDAYNKSNKSTKDLYKQLKDDYFISYKAVAKGKTETIIANVNITDSNVKLQDIIFKTKEGIAISKIDSTATSYTLALKGTFTDADIETQALVKQKGIYEVAGAFIQYQATIKEVDVVLVNTTNNNIQKIKNKLYSIYEKALVKLNIKEITDFSIDLNLLTSNGIIESGESGFAAQYTKQQGKINSALKNRSDFNQKAHYLIITNKKPSTKNEKGLMPLGRQFGYIYISNGADENTVAHELGHGAFQLKHPFSSHSYGYKQNDTDWLLDYNGNEKLPYVHWKKIHNPSLRIGFFDKDSEGESVSTIMPISLSIDEKKYNGKYYYGYLTPSGERIILSEDYTPIFFHGIESDTYNAVVPGTLIGFKQKGKQKNVGEIEIKDIQYKAKIVNNEFLGYENFTYEKPNIKGNKENSFVIGIPYGAPVTDKGHWRNYKFNDNDIPEYEGQNKKVIAITSDEFQRIGLFSTLKSIKVERFRNPIEILGERQIDVTPLEIKLLSGDFNSEFVIAVKNNVGRKRFKNVSISHNERREVFLIIKIAEIYNRFPRIFEEFTSFFNNWDKGILNKSFSGYGKWEHENIPFGKESSNSYKTWKNNLKSANSNNELYDFYQAFLIELLAYTSQKVAKNKACLLADFTSKTNQEVFECISRASDDQLTEMLLGQQIIAIKKILLSSNEGGDISDKKEIEIARVLEAISKTPASYDKALTAFEEEEITYNWILLSGQVQQQQNSVIPLSKTYPLWYALFNNIEDEIFVFGEDNRQSIVKSIGKIFIGSKRFIDQLKSNLNPEILKLLTFEDLKSIHDSFYTYENDYQNIFRRGWSHIKTGIRSKIPLITIYDTDDFYKSVDTKITNDYLINAKQKIKWGYVKNEIEKESYLKPFELVSFINISKNNLLKPFTNRNEEGNPQSLFLPALTLHYASKVDALQTKSDIIQTSVDLLSFLPTGGVAALNTFGKFLYYADKMSSVSSMSGTAFRENDPELAAYMNQLSLVTGVVSLAVFSELLKSGITHKKIGDVIHPEVLKESNDQVINVNKLVEDILKDRELLQKLAQGQLTLSRVTLEREIESLKNLPNFNLVKAKEALLKLKNLEDLNKTIYKNVKIVGNSYPESGVDIKISELTPLHPVPRRTQLDGVDKVVKLIKKEGFDIEGGTGNLPVRVIELPNGIKIVANGMHRVEAMGNVFKETHIPVIYNTYEEIYKGFNEGMDRKSIDNLFVMLHIGQRTGYYTDSWMPVLPWEINGRNKALKEVDDFMKREFPDLAESEKGLLASLKAMITDTKLKTVFETEFKGNSAKLKEFAENPNLVDDWIDIQKVLNENIDAFPENIDFTTLNFDTGDDFVDVIIHYNNGNFVLKMEGKEEVFTMENLAEFMNFVAKGDRIRLLSCNSAEAAIALSKIVEKPFYASDGMVKLYEDGKIVHDTPFKKYHKGVRSDLDEIPPNIEPGKGKVIILGEGKGKGVYKSIRIVGGPYPEGYRDLKISELTPIHPVPRKSKIGSVDKVVKEIQETGFKIKGEEVTGKDPVRVIGLPDKTKLVINGMYRVEAMSRLKETHIPVVYDTYDEIYKSFKSGGLGVKHIENVFNALHIGKRTGYYKGNWMPDIPWQGNRKNEVLKEVDDFMKKEFPDLAELPEGLLASLKGLISNEKLKEVFESNFKGNIEKLKEFTENPNLIDSWINIQKVLAENTNAFPKNIDFTGFNFDTGDNYIDVIIHYKAGKFISKVEGREEIVSIEKLAAIINSIPANQKIRLLSCSTEEAAIELSKLTTERAFYANNGRVKLYSDGEVVHVTPFKRYHKGARSDLDEIPPNIEPRKGTPIVLGKEDNLTELDLLFNKIFTLRIPNNSIRKIIKDFKITKQEEASFIKYLATLNGSLIDEINLEIKLIESVKVLFDLNLGSLLISKKSSKIKYSTLKNVENILKNQGGYYKWKTLNKENKLWENVVITSNEKLVISLLDGKKLKNSDELGGFYKDNLDVLLIEFNTPEYLRGQKLATEVYKKIIQKNKPKELLEIWKGLKKESDFLIGSSKSLEVYNEQLKLGVKREVAVFETPSGKLAKANGFSGTPVFKVDEKGSVEVFFTRPEYTTRTKIRQLFYKLDEVNDEKLLNDFIKKIESFDESVAKEFIRSFKDDKKALKKFFEDPDLIEVNENLSNLLKNNPNTYVKDINFKVFKLDERDDFIDIIIHSKNNNFIVKIEGKEEVISPSNLNFYINLLSNNKKIRILSCNTNKSAIALSKIIERPFYASSGIRKLYEDGKVVHDKPFKKYHKGVGSDLDEIPPNKEPGKGDVIILGREEKITEVDLLFNERFTLIADPIREIIRGFRITKEEEIFFIKYMTNKLSDHVYGKVRSNHKLVEPLKIICDITLGAPYTMPIRDMNMIKDILDTKGGYYKWKKGNKDNKLWKNIEISSNGEIEVVLLNDVRKDDIGEFYEPIPGVVSMSFRIPKFLRRQKLGSELYQKIIQEKKPKELVEVWEHLRKDDIALEQISTSLETYNEQLKLGLKREEAVFETPSGKLAKANGFSGTPVFKVDKEDYVEVFFTKPEHSIRTKIRQLFYQLNGAGDENVFHNFIKKIESFDDSIAKEFITSFKDNNKFLQDFFYNPNLIDSWKYSIIRIKEILDNYPDIYSGGLNFAKFKFNKNDDFIDIVIHSKDNKFVVKVEGEYREVSLFSLGIYANSLPEGKKLRLLSCNSDELAIELSKFIERPFYASNGIVKLYADGKIVHDTPFKRYHRGARSDIDEIPPNAIPGKGDVIVLGKKEGDLTSQIDEILGNKSTLVKDKIKQLSFSSEEVNAFSNYLVLTEGAKEIIVSNLNLIKTWKTYYEISPKTHSSITTIDLQQTEKLVNIIEKDYGKNTALAFIKDLKNQKNTLKEFSENLKLIDIWLGVYEIKKIFKRIEEDAPKSVNNLLEKIRDLDIDYIQIFIKDFKNLNQSDLKKLTETPDLIDSWKLLLEKGSNNRTNFDFLKFFKQKGARRSIEDVEKKIAILNDQYPNMFIEELAAIYNYTIMAYVKLNSALRGRIAMTEDIKIFDKILKKALTKLPEKYDGKTFRGTEVRKVRLKEYKKAFENKTKITEKGYTSASKNEKIAKSFVPREAEIDRERVFFTIESTKGVDIEKVSVDGPTFKNGYNESEILHLSNTEYFITKYSETIDKDGAVLILITLSDLKAVVLSTKEKNVIKINAIFKNESNSINQKIEELGFTEKIYEDFIASFSKVEKEIINAIETNPSLIESWKTYYDINSSKPFNLKINELEEIDEILKEIGGYKKWKTTENGKLNRLWDKIEVLNSEIQLTYLSGKKVNVGDFNISKIDALSFDIILPSILQKQGVTTNFFKEIFKIHNPSEIICHWIRADSYDDNISTNLQEYFKHKDKGNEKAAFMTPSGKIAERNGFTAEPFFLKNDNYEVRVVFSKEGNTTRRDIRKLFRELDSDSDFEMDNIIKNLESFDEITINRFISDYKKATNEELNSIFNSTMLIDNWKLLNKINSPNRLDVDFLKFLNIDLVIDSWYKVIEKKDVLKQYYPNNTLDELTSVYHYTSSLFTVENFNKALRGGAPMTKKLQTFDNVLRKSLKKFPKYFKTTYRGIETNKQELKRYKEAYENKTKVEELGYTSTSKEKLVAEIFTSKQENNENVGVLFTVKSKKGLDIEGISLYGPSFSNNTESEVLFISGEKFKVTEYNVTIYENKRELILITLTD